MILINIKQWLREDCPQLADNIVDTNKKQFLKNNISGFGMKKKVESLINLLRAALFPSIYETEAPDSFLISAMVNQKLSTSAIKLNSIVRDVFVKKCNADESKKQNCDTCVSHAEQCTIAFMNKLPEIRHLLCTDIHAAYAGDPAAVHVEEIILSYPSIEAITIYRMAHELFVLEVPLIPRIMTEFAHQWTGIDIHPGASIGKSFFIDHGTGVVIGETCTIGERVKLYQGVTLGAKSFELDEHGNPIKGIKRHPDIGDDVVIYSGATILGGNTVIGRNSIIGGNVWLTSSVPPYSKVYNSSPSPHIK